MTVIYVDMYEFLLSVTNVYYVGSFFFFFGIIFCILLVRLRLVGKQCCGIVLRATFVSKGLLQRQRFVGEYT